MLTAVQRRWEILAAVPHTVTWNNRLFLYTVFHKCFCYTYSHYRQGNQEKPSANKRSGRMSPSPQEESNTHVYVPTPSPPWSGGFDRFRGWYRNWVKTCHEPSRAFFNLRELGVAGPRVPGHRAEKSVLWPPHLPRSSAGPCGGAPGPPPARR